jgi:hypothetical protein
MNQKESLKLALEFWDGEKYMAELALAEANDYLRVLEEGLCAVYLEEQRGLPQTNPDTSVPPPLS